MHQVLKLAPHRRRKHFGHASPCVYAHAPKYASFMRHRGMRQNETGRGGVRTLGMRNRTPEAHL